MADCQYDLGWDAVGKSENGEDFIHHSIFSIPMLPLSELRGDSWNELLKRVNSTYGKNRIIPINDEKHIVQCCLHAMQGYKETLY